VTTPTGVSIRCTPDADPAEMQRRDEADRAVAASAEIADVVEEDRRGDADRSDGSHSKAPTITSEPRGSLTTAERKRSCCVPKCFSRSGHRAVAERGASPRRRRASVRRRYANRPRTRWTCGSSGADLSGGGAHAASEGSCRGDRRMPSRASRARPVRSAPPAERAARPASSRCFSSFGRVVEPAWMMASTRGARRPRASCAARGPTRRRGRLLHRELDVLHELHRDVEVQQRREPAVQFARLLRTGRRASDPTAAGSQREGEAEARDPAGRCRASSPRARGRRRRRRSHSGRRRHCRCR
jgi:hypothetical protein